MNKIYISLLLYIIFIISITLCDSNSDSDNDRFTVCGGFIKNSFNDNSNSDNNIDYKKIIVKLISNKNNKVIEVSDCSPLDGYYFLPVYDKGSYRIEIESPFGWVFDINSYTVTDLDQCKDKDINFELLGFKVDGFIKSDESCLINKVSDTIEALKIIDYSSIKVQLIKKTISHDSDNDNEDDDDNTPLIEILEIVNCDRNGYYKFDGIKPLLLSSSKTTTTASTTTTTSSYIVSVTRQNWNFIKNEIEFNNFQNFDNYRLSESFIINGFDLYGTILNEGNPVDKVTFSLYSLSINSIKDCKPFSNTIIKGYNSICSVESNENGYFNIGNIPCGNDFKLIPQYKKENIKYEIEPEEFEIKVNGSGSLIINNDVFKIKGFSIAGLIVDDDGKPFTYKSVDIYLNDKFKTKSDSNGLYILEDMKWLPYYKIEAKLQNYNFQSPLQLIIQPPSTINQDLSIPDIKIVSFKITGKLNLPTKLKEISKTTTNHQKSSLFDIIDENSPPPPTTTESKFNFNLIEIYLYEIITTTTTTSNTNIGDSELIESRILVGITKLNSKGEFEFDDIIKSTDYIVKVKSNQKEMIDHQIQLEKDEIKVTVDHKSIDGIIFQQLLSIIHGKIKPLKKSNNLKVPKNLYVELIKEIIIEDNQQLQVKEIKEETEEEEEQIKVESPPINNNIVSIISIFITPTINNQGEISFTFKDLLPGIYKLKMDYNYWYWEHDEIVIDALPILDYSNYENNNNNNNNNNEGDPINFVEFIQIGYKFEIDSNEIIIQDSELLIDNSSDGGNNSISSEISNTIISHRFNGETIENIPLKIGKNYLNLEQSGIHQFIIKSCFQFKHDGSYKFDTDSIISSSVTSNSIKLEIEKYLIQGSIDLTNLFKDNHHHLKSLLQVKDNISIKLKIFDNNNHQLIDQIDTSIESLYIYQYNFMISIEKDSFQIIPFIYFNNGIGSSNSEELQLFKDSILFYPFSKFIQIPLIEKGKCQLPIPPFIAKIGKFKQGRIISSSDSTSLENVKIIATPIGKIITNEDGTTIEVASKEVLLIPVTSLSNEFGEFKIGPLYEDVNYQFNAIKDGFYFNRDSTSSSSSSSSIDFNIIEYGSITVIVKDSKSDLPISNVLLSLSGGSTSTSISDSKNNNEYYRKKVYLSNNGTFEFKSLLPNKYFLGSILKGYSISPNSQTIQVISGKEQIINLAAKKTLFSVSGRIFTLNSQPFPNVIVNIYKIVEEESTSTIHKPIKFTKTDKDGYYILKGLTNDNSSSNSNSINNYQIKISINNNNNNEIKSSPNYQIINFNQDKDIENIDFILITTSTSTSSLSHSSSLESTFQLTGNIIMDSNLNSYKKQLQILNYQNSNNNNYNNNNNNNNNNNLLLNGLKVNIYTTSRMGNQLLLVKSSDITMFNTFSSLLEKSKLNSKPYIIKIESSTSNNNNNNNNNNLFAILPNEIEIPLECSNYKEECKVTFEIKFNRNIKNNNDILLDFNNNNNNNNNNNINNNNNNNNNSIISIQWLSLLLGILIILTMFYPNRMFLIFKSIFTLDFLKLYITTNNSNGGNIKQSKSKKKKL